MASVTHRLDRMDAVARERRRLAPHHANISDLDRRVDCRASPTTGRGRHERRASATITPHHAHDQHEAGDAATEAARIRAGADIAAANQARDDFARDLDRATPFKSTGFVALDNAIEDANVTTGDHDGRAVLLQAGRP